jgi:hypothetical protein
MQLFLFVLTARALKAHRNGRLFARLSPGEIRRERDAIPLPDSPIRACNKATNEPKIRGAAKDRIWPARL